MKKFILTFLIIIISSYSPILPTQEVELGYDSFWNDLNRVSTPKQELCSAIKAGNIEKIQNLLSSGVNANETFHVLILGFQKSHGCNLDETTGRQIGRLLLQYADINKVIGGRAALNEAAYYGIPEAVELLVYLDADLNIHDDISNDTPLTEASRAFFSNEKSNYLLIVNTLLKAGADINLTNKFGNSALIRATESNNLEIVFLLLMNGADTTIKNNKNEIFFTFLEKQQILNVAKEFIEYLVNSDENIAEYTGAQNALLIAAYLNDANVVKALLEKGAWLSSEKYVLYFNNLIADKPAIHEVIKQYKKSVAKEISENTNIIPDIANIIAEY